MTRYEDYEERCNCGYVPSYCASRMCDRKRSVSVENEFTNQSQQDWGKDVGYDDDGNPVSEWHIDKLCAMYGFSADDANVIKSEYDKVFQGMFGGTPTLNNPSQYGQRSVRRMGDPSGVLGYMFALVRHVYFAIEHVPILNSPRLWGFLDRIVLANRTHDTVKRYLYSAKYSR